VRKGANVFLIIGAVVALGALFPAALLASDGGDPAEPARQAREDRWVPSLAITSGATIQEQQGSADSCLFPGNMSPDSCNTRANPPDPGLRGFVDGDDLAVSPFVGGALELMTPALPIPTRPRLFASGEILPTFAPDRHVALEGDPGCVRGPLSGAGCARLGETEAFSENAANGLGTKTSARVDTLVYGASLGVAFPLKVGKRQLRIKPSVGWINYKLEAEALVVGAACDLVDECIVLKQDNGDIEDKDTLRERTLTASGSQMFNGIGPGLDVEMDTGRFGPIGSSLFLGARAYRILGNRTISFRTEKLLENDTTPIIFGPETNVGVFEVKVDPWMFRAHVGIRFYWLGSRK
jgi:hypothetical protein